MTAPATAPDTRPYSPGLEGVVAAESASVSSTARTAGCSTAATPSATSSSTGPIRRSRTCSGPASGIRRLACPRRPCRKRCSPPCARWSGCQADGRAAHRGLGVGRDHDARVAADGRRCAPAHRLLAVGARRVCAHPGGQGARRPRPVADSCRASCTSSTASARTTRRPGRSTRTSSSAPSTGSTRPPSLRASSPRRGPTWRPRCAARSARSRGRSMAVPERGRRADP